ncbi:hypothetical protein MTO96_031523 [Rhipicephalus appendiculatus]
MKRCMADTLAETYCLTGRKGKKPFRDLRLLSVIIAALQKSYPKCTESELHRLIGDHLRYAPSRCKKCSDISPHVDLEVEASAYSSDH